MARGRHFRIGTLALLAAALGACATTPHLACPAGQQAMTNESLYFGTAKAQGIVTPEDWQAFLQAEVTPRFPEGLTVLAASGQWRSTGGVIVISSVAGDPATYALKCGRAAVIVCATVSICDAIAVGAPDGSR